MAYSEAQELYVSSADGLVGRASAGDVNYFLYRNKLSGVYGYNTTFKKFGRNAIEDAAMERTRWFRKPTVFDVCGTAESLRELHGRGSLGRGIAFAFYDPRDDQQKMGDRRKHIEFVEGNALRRVGDYKGIADVVLLRPGRGIENVTYENGVFQIFLLSLLGSLREGGVLFAQCPDLESFKVDQKLADLSLFLETLRGDYDVDFAPIGWTRQSLVGSSEKYPIVKIVKK